jgi:hypothetical protein
MATTGEARQAPLFRLLAADDRIGEAIGQRFEKSRKQTTAGIYALIPNAAELEWEFGVDKGTLV